jgi:hypothetical protein
MELSPELVRVARESAIVNHCLSAARVGHITYDEALGHAIDGLAEQYRSLKALLLEKGYDLDSKLRETATLPQVVSIPDDVVNSSLDSTNKIIALWQAVSNVRSIAEHWISTMPPEPIRVAVDQIDPDILAKIKLD